MDNKQLLNIEYVPDDILSDEHILAYLLYENTSKITI